MKKLAIILSALVLALSMTACTGNKDAKTSSPNNLKTDGTQTVQTGTASELEERVNKFLETAPVIEDEQEIEGEKDTTPLSEIYEIPYQYDLTPYIDIAKEDYTGISLVAMNSDVTAAAMTEAIKADLSNYGEEVEITDRGAEMGDTLDINFTGYESGVAFDGGTAENYEMVLGQAGFIEGFEEQLVGHKTGEEFTIDVTFPEDYAPNLAGKPAQFVIKINSIKSTSLVELTDDFVKENFYCETVDDYLLQKYKELHETNTMEVDNAQKSLAYSTVYESVTVKELPIDRFDYYSEKIKEDLTSTAEMYGMDLETFVEQNGMTMEDFEAYVSEQATAIVEQELVAFSIAKNEGLLDTLTKTDYDKYLNEIAASYGTDAETFLQSYPADMIANSLVLEVAINFVVDNAVIK